MVTILCSWVVYGRRPYEADQGGFATGGESSKVPAGAPADTKL